MHTRGRGRFPVAETVLLAWLVLLLFNVVWPVSTEIVVVGIVVSVVVIGAVAWNNWNARA